MGKDQPLLPYNPTSDPDDREKHIAERRHLTVGNELPFLEKELEALQRRVRALKGRA